MEVLKVDCMQELREVLSMASIDMNCNSYQFLQSQAIAYLKEKFSKSKMGITSDLMKKYTQIAVIYVQNLTENAQHSQIKFLASILHQAVEVSTSTHHEFATHQNLFKMMVEEGEKIRIKKRENERKRNFDNAVRESVVTPEFKDLATSSILASNEDQFGKRNFVSEEVRRKRILREID